VKGNASAALVLALVCATVPATTGGAQAPVASAALGVPDLDGREVLPFAVEGARAYALIFVRPGCPVSNRAAPEVARLYEEFAARGVAMWLVYPGRQPLDGIRQHVREFSYPLTPLRDPSMRLVDLAGVSITPEAAIFDASRRLVYRGRLDDRYLDIGRARREPTVRDAHDVLSALLAGRPVPYASRPAVGCFIDDLR
jgi:hypothetical protein